MLRFAEAGSQCVACLCIIHFMAFQKISLLSWIICIMCPWLSSLSLGNTWSSLKICWIALFLLWMVTVWWKARCIFDGLDDIRFDTPCSFVYNRNCGISASFVMVERCILMLWKMCKLHIFNHIQACKGKYFHAVPFLLLWCDELG